MAMRTVGRTMVEAPFGIRFIAVWPARMTEDHKLIRHLKTPDTSYPPLRKISCLHQSGSAYPLGQGTGVHAVTVNANAKEIENNVDIPLVEHPRSFSSEGIGQSLTRLVTSGNCTTPVRIILRESVVLLVLSTSPYREYDGIVYRSRRCTDR
jgi:hypothetical protein